jgi:peptidoglycan/xylan/chitin deacetylase (PgdA/CDA1 family)
MSAALRVLLTFDDGPHPVYTPDLLDLLARERVRATFFVSGKHVAAPGGLAIVQRAAAEGHVIGNHAYSHQRLTGRSRDYVRAEILQTHDLIAEFEPGVRLFRPPYGAHDAIVDAVLEELGYRLVLWDVDSEDWKATNQEWVDVALARLGSSGRAIVLCHDKTAATVGSMKRFLDRLRLVPSCEVVAPVGIDAF